MTHQLKKKKCETWYDRDTYLKIINYLAFYFHFDILFQLKWSNNIEIVHWASFQRIEKLDKLAIEAWEIVTMSRFRTISFFSFFRFRMVIEKECVASGVCRSITRCTPRWHYYFVTLVYFSETLFLCERWQGRSVKRRKINDVVSA